MDEFRVSVDIDGLLQVFSAAWAIEHDFGPMEFGSELTNEGQTFWIVPGQVIVWPKELEDKCREEKERYDKLTDLKPSQAKLLIHPQGFRFSEK